MVESKPQRKQVVWTERWMWTLGICFFLTACTAPVTKPAVPGKPPVARLAADPLDATYEIENEPVPLVDGAAERWAAEGSATRVQTRVFGKPVHGDLDGDGDDDLVLWLLHQSGGSGSFYYLAAALNQSGSYQGTRAVLVGDRVAPENLAIKNGVVRARYADRGFSEPMAHPPSSSKTAYFILEAAGLDAVTPVTSGDEILQGWFVTGHAVRSFRPCSRERGVWLMGASPALRDLLITHKATLPGARPYMPLFVTLAGRLVEAPSEGFGSDYEEGLVATRLVKVWPQGNCKSDRIILDSPLPGAILRSPLKIRGRAKGSWFFEGDFPLLLLDENQNLLAQGYATAQSDWMTQGFVRFEGTLVFKQPPKVTRGVLVLKKDNPTGSARFDDALKLPIGFE